MTDAERYSDKILRTPNLYGYFTASYTPVKPFTIAFNGNYTGRMYVPHLMSEVNGTADVLVKSPDFFELGVKLSYDFRLTAAMTLQLNLGIQNLFDSYQNDFDKGQPVTPATFTVRELPHLLCGGKVQFLIFLYGRLFVISFPSYLNFRFRRPYAGSLCCCRL